MKYIHCVPVETVELFNIFFNGTQWFPNWFKIYNNFLWKYLISQPWVNDIKLNILYKNKLN